MFEKDLLYMPVSVSRIVSYCIICILIIFSFLFTALIGGRFVHFLLFDSQPLLAVVGLLIFISFTVIALFVTMWAVYSQIDSDSPIDLRQGILDISIAIKQWFLYTVLLKRDWENSNAREE